jgi:outer membrane lipoprotein SlyB
MKHPLAVTLAVTASLLASAGCAQKSSQNTYNYNEVGRAASVTFGSVVSARMVDINGKNTGVGALLGGAAGAGAGSYIGNGSGSIWGAAAGAVIGAVAGGAAEQATSNRRGIEYLVMLESGEAMTVVQDIANDEQPIAAGSRVMVQNSGGYQRVLPADNLPTQVARPQGMTVVDAAK